VAHVTWTDEGLKLLIERSKTDKQGEGAELRFRVATPRRPALSPALKVGSRWLRSRPARCSARSTAAVRSSP
jgi:hypothetical protein